MEMINAMRGIERIIIVALGGLSIYLGYMLFKLIPRQRDGQGKASLPGGISIFLSRVGPGVFFALFGTVVIAVAMVSPVKTEINSGPNGQPIVTTTQLGDQTASQPGEQNLEQARLRVRTHLQVLNRLSGMLRSDLTEGQRNDLNNTIKSIKLDLIKQVWGNWGDFQQFADWANRGASDAPPAGLEAAADLYLYGL